MTGLAAPLLKWGVMDRIKKPLIRRTMRVVTAQARITRGFHTLMDITETRRFVIVAGETKLRGLALYKITGRAAMGGMT